MENLRLKEETIKVAVEHIIDLVRINDSSYMPNDPQLSEELAELLATVFNAQVAHLAVPDEEVEQTVKAERERVFAEIRRKLVYIAIDVRDGKEVLHLQSNGKRAAEIWESLKASK